jgi:multidrug efflux pump subunit AcrA (membrane-fusion protein)
MKFLNFTLSKELFQYERIAPLLKKRRTFFITGFAIAFALIFAAGYLSKNADTVKVRRGSIVESVYGIGTVTANHTYVLRIAVAAEIARLYVREGDIVKKGSPLLMVTGIPPFTAPFEGTITALPFAEGEIVFPQIPLLTLIDVRDRYVSVTLEQEAALRVRKGQRVRLSFESLRGIRLNGTLRTIFPRQGQFIINIDVPELPPEVLPGMTADVAIEVDGNENALLVPLSAVHNGWITLIRDGKRMKVEVQIGSVDGEWAEVLSDNVLETDEVVRGQ